MATLLGYLEARRAFYTKQRNPERFDELENTLAIMRSVKFDDYKPVETPVCHWCREQKSGGLIQYVGGRGDVWMCSDCEKTIVS